MSDYSGVAPPTNFSQSSAFAAALQRARQIAAKINPGSGSAAGNSEPAVGLKRPLEEGSGDFEPDSKKVATGSSGGGNSSGGSTGSGGATIQAAATAAAVAARVAGTAAPGIQGLGAVPGLNGSVSSEDVKVPDKMVGLIIGRGGEQISRLQSESGCKIQMALDSGGAPERLCTLTGNPQAISRAKEMIGSIISQRSKSEGMGGARLDELGFGGLGDSGMGSNSSDGHMSGPGGHSDMDRGSMMSHGSAQGSQGGFQLPSTVEIMVPGVKVGLIIGKGGETIKQLQEKSGTKMVVVQDGPSQENEKPLRISGEPQKVEHAKALVYELISDKDGQRRDDRRGGRMGFDRGGGRDGGRGGRGGWGNERGDQQESTFIVPATKCGIIIGRGGETIKQINQTSGAHCELDRRSQANPTEKTFLIRGQPDQIETAKRMIAEKLGSISGQDQNGGGPQFGSGMPPGGPGGAPGGPHFPPQNWGSGPQGFQQPWNNPQQPHPQDPNMFAAAQNNQVQVPMNPQTGQPDYSTQWAEYYRSVGMHREAELIEQQAKANKGLSTMPQGQTGQQASQPAGANTQGAQNGQPDYSAQWAEYYRSTGKIKEAEFIEQQMKSKQAATVGGVTPGGGPQPGVGMPNPYTQPQPYGYGAAAGGFYGATPQPPAGQPGQPQYPGYPGYAQAYHMQAPGQAVPPDGQ